MNEQAKKIEGQAFAPLARVLFLDIDGTVRYSKSGKFITGPDDIALFDGVEDAIWNYRNAGYIICGVSNQGGIAHGFKTLEDVGREMVYTMDMFRKNPFHTMQFCALDETGTVEPYNHRSLMRKPNIGMLVMAEQQFSQQGVVIDWDNSIMVGDREEDQQCAATAGVPFRWAHEFFGRTQ